MFSEQLGLIGRALWREAAVLAAGFALLTAIVLHEIIRHGMKADFPIDAGLLLAALSLLTPFAIWRGERVFGHGHLWTLPVERRAHILIKTLAGGVWLFGVLAWIMLWLAVMGLISASDLGVDRNLLLGQPGPGGEVTQDMIRKIRWVPQTWNWISAFTNGAIFYLLGTAVVLGVRYKLRWAAVVFVAMLLLTMGPSSAGQPNRIAELIAEAVLTSPVGLDNALSGGAEDLETSIRLPGDVQAVAWTGLPSFEAWLRATAFWLALAGTLFGLAAARHKER